MSGLLDWLVGDDSALSIAANLLAVGTFVVGLIPALRWANDLRREIREIRRRLRAAAGEVFWERASFQNIKLLRRVTDGDDTQWHVLWARLNTADEKDWHRGSATITSKHLLKVLEKEPRRIDASRYATVVGTVTCADHGEGNYSSVMIPTVLHIHGDAGWRKAVFEMRQWLARLVGEIV